MSLRAEQQITLAMYCWIWKFGIGAMPHFPTLSLVLRIAPMALQNLMLLDPAAAALAAGLVPVANLTCFATSDLSNNAIAQVCSSSSVFSFVALAMIFSTSALYCLVFLMPLISLAGILRFLPYLVVFFPFFHSFQCWSNF